MQTLRVRPQGNRESVPPEMTTGHEFGRYIREQRVASGISLRKTAKAMNISAVYLGEVERGIRPPLKEIRWDALIKAVPTIDRSWLSLLALKTKPLKVDLRNSPIEYQDLAINLVQRIDEQSLTREEILSIFSILKRENK